MSKKGLPVNIGMRHDAHYVEELARTKRSVGRVIFINQIEPNPEQPRIEIGDLTELSNSIKENGVLEPLLVKPNRQTGTWMIIAGERRWRAANLAGLSEVPCIELDIDDKTVAEIALIENLQRKDLTVWEEADGLKSLGARFGYKHDEIAKKISKSRTTVTELLTIANLPSEIRERCLDAKINSKSTLLELARQFDERAMNKMLGALLDKKLSRDELRRAARPGAENGKKTAADKNNKKSINARDEKVFHYNSPAGDFYLEIKFEQSVLSEENIVRALETAIDAVRSKFDEHW